MNVFIILLCIGTIFTQSNPCNNCTYFGTTCISFGIDVCDCLKQEKECYLNNTYNGTNCFSTNKDNWEKDCKAGECKTCVTHCDDCHIKYQGCNSNKCTCLQSLKKCYDEYPKYCKTKADALANTLCETCTTTCVTSDSDDNSWTGSKIAGVICGSVVICLVVVITCLLACASEED